jgi:hypothetical protein
LFEYPKTDMKKLLFSFLLAGALVSCHSNGKSIDTDKIDSSASTEATDKTAVAADSAKRTSDSLVNASPDTLKAK